MISRKTLTTLTIMIALIAFGAGVGIFSARQQQAQSIPQVPGLMWPDPRHLQAFTTIDEHGREFGLEDLVGKWSFLFFGYTNCPDICPITLAVLDQVYDRTRNEYQHNDLQVLFVSVDPERDTTEQLFNYVNYFNEDFHGLGGTTEQIETLTRQIGIAYFHAPGENDGNYLVDHSASIFLVDPRGQLVAMLSAPHETEDILSRYRQIRSFIDRQAAG